MTLMTMFRFLVLSALVWQPMSGCSVENDRVDVSASDAGNEGQQPPEPGCEDPRSVHFLGPDSTLREETNLTICVRDFGRGFYFPERIDRTGRSLCSPDPIPAPCLHGNCETACTNNEECGPQKACLCATGTAAPVGSPMSYIPLRENSRCVDSQCESSADCNGFACGYSRGNCDAYPDPGFYCRTPEDECQVDSDCDTDRCIFDQTKSHWACVWVGGGCS